MTGSARSSGQLLTVLGVTFGVAVAVGNIIGSGILRAPASIAHTLPDVNWIMALWVLGAVHALLGANVFAELATSVPKSGGPYVFAQKAFGDTVGYIVGISAFLSALAGAAAASISFAEFLPLLIPAAAAHKLTIALSMQMLLYTANYVGVRQGSAVQIVTSGIKVTMLLVFAIAAIEVAAPVAPASAPPVQFGWLAVIGAFNLIAGAYSGWEAPVNFSEENVNPGKDLPRALFFGILTAALVFIAVNGALLYALGLSGTAATPLPFSTVLARVGGPLPAILFALGALITVTGTANAIIMKVPRQLFAMARDGLLPRQLTSVNTGGTPNFAMVLMAVISLGLAATGSFKLVFGLIALLDSVNAVLTFAALFMLRRRYPNIPRPYLARGYPWLPAATLAINLALLILFAGSDVLGFEFAVGLSLACVPLTIIARRARAAALP